MLCNSNKYDLFYSVRHSDSHKPSTQNFLVAFMAKVKAYMEDRDQESNSH